MYTECVQSRPSQRGVTLIEQIMFIIIISVGVAGLVSVINPMIAHSADPMQTKQMMAVADSVMNEVIHQPFTWCDPDDATASTALSYADCAHPQSAATAGEARAGGVGAVFDNVMDYAGWGMNDVSDPSGSFAMTGYTVAVAVASAGTAMGLTDDSAALSITVTVTHGTDTYALTGYRFRYAPRY
jgi:MSHA pilin protein MshD